ncbi:putative choline monooxygenase, chloroplastic [Sesbania bispinosa]|nr:putative choline monooxygenase, chloroplastic [Sesbania bispinosa]
MAVKGQNLEVVEELIKADPFRLKTQLSSIPSLGWTYGLNETLLKATRISGMRDFNVNACSSILC